MIPNLQNFQALPGTNYQYRIVDSYLTFLLLTHLLQTSPAEICFLTGLLIRLNRLVKPCNQLFLAGRTNCRQGNLDQKGQVKVQYVYISSPSLSFLDCFYY